MSMVQEIDVVIRPDGQVEVRVRGVNGPGCLAATRELEAALGGRVLSREHTDELDQPAEQESDVEHTRHRR